MELVFKKKVNYSPLMFFVEKWMIFALAAAILRGASYAKCTKKWSLWGRLHFREAGRDASDASIENDLISVEWMFQTQ